MAITVRKLDSLMVAASVTAANSRRLDLLKVKAGTIFHGDATPFTTAAAATDLPTCVAMANAVSAVYTTHIASACDAVTGQGAHIGTDATNTVTAAAATDQTTANALLNDVKAKYSLHRAVAANHATADATNTIASANATDLTTSLTLVNELQGDIALHMAGALATQAILLVSP